MARAICSKKFVSRSNSLSYPFKKICQLFKRLELSFQKNLSAVQTVWAIRSSQLFERLELSVPKKIVSLWNGSSCPVQKNWSTVPAICWKKQTVTSSFHWKVKCCEWILRGDVFISFRKYCRGVSQLRSTQLFTRAKTFHRVEYSWLLTVTTSQQD